MRSDLLPGLVFTLLIEGGLFVWAAAPVAGQQDCGPGGTCPAGQVCNPATNVCMDVGAPTPTQTGAATPTATIASTPTTTATPHTTPAASPRGLVALGAALAGVAWLALRRKRGHS